MWSARGDGGYFTTGYQWLDPIYTYLLSRYLVPRADVFLCLWRLHCGLI
jgi:hypothetical protein